MHCYVSSIWHVLPRIHNFTSHKYLDLQASCTVFLYCKNFDVFFDVFDLCIDYIIISFDFLDIFVSRIPTYVHTTHEGYVHFRGHDQGHDLFKVSRYTCVILHNSFVPKITISKAFSLLA